MEDLGQLQAQATQADRKVARMHADSWAWIGEKAHLNEGRSLHQQMVDAFMGKAGQELRPVPSELTMDERYLRAMLILEEAFETIEKGLGMKVFSCMRDRPGTVGGIIKQCAIGFKDLTTHPVTEMNLVELADGCCDLRVVTTGTLSAAGISDQLPQIAVDESNLRKFGPGGHRRDDGKWIKPHDWTPPPLLDILIRQGYVPPEQRG